jgi:hypothetical protein
MAVLVTSDLLGVTDLEDRERAPMMKLLRKQKGLMLHADGPSDCGWRAISIWESREDFERFFDAAIRPNLPPGAPVRDVVSELSHVLLPGRRQDNRRQEKGAEVR